MLQLNNVSKSFMQNGKKFQALDNISFQVKEGEFVSLLGPSGCGKSTVLKMIAGLESADAGSTILLQNKKITKPVPEQMMVFQEAALFPWLTVFENVSFGLKTIGLSKKEVEEQAKYYIAMVHMSKFIDQYPHQLSGGMRQRVSIARALALNPKILLMDEPFSALDEQTRLLLHVELEEIVMKTKKSIVFVTHNIREAVTLSDRILTFSTRPGTIKQEFSIKMGRPRIMTQDLLTIENQILEVLRDEIEKVMKNEIDDTYEFKSRSLSSRDTHDMGSGI